jgi:hypothetical protein
MGEDSAIFYYAKSVIFFRLFCLMNPALCIWSFERNCMSTGAGNAVTEQHDKKNCVTALQNDGCILFSIWSQDEDSF